MTCHVCTKLWLATAVFDNLVQTLVLAAAGSVTASAGPCRLIRRCTSRFIFNQTGRYSGRPCTQGCEACLPQTCMHMHDHLGRALSPMNQSRRITTIRLCNTAWRLLTPTARRFVPGLTDLEHEASLTGAFKCVRDIDDTISTDTDAFDGSIHDHSGHGVNGLCRQEWTNQQAVRTASVQHVARLSTSVAKEVYHRHDAFFKYIQRFSTAWLPNLKHRRDCNFLVFESAHGHTQFYNADDMRTAIQPSTNGLEPFDHSTAFVGTDGNVQIADKYHQDHSKKPERFILHMTAGLMLAKPSGSDMVIIVDAETMTEVSRWTITAQHLDSAFESLAAQAQGNVALSVGNLAWSAKGNMLALSMQIQIHDEASAFVHRLVQSAPPITAAFELHMYDTSSGDCLHSANLAIEPDSIGFWSGVRSWGLHGKVTLSWSCTQDLLAMSESHDSSLTVFAFTPSAPHIANGSLQPLQVPTKPTSTRRLVPGLCRCSWTPCGTLLVALSKDHGFLIFHPHTLETIFSTPVARPEAGIYCSWAQKPSFGSESNIVLAYLREQHVLITCRYIRGEWQSQACTLTGLASCLGGFITPSGRAIGSLQQQDDGSTYLVHHRLSSSQTYTIASAYLPIQSPQLCEKDPPSVRPVWAPFPSAWPNIYACIHMPLAERRLGPYGSPDLSLKPLRPQSSPQSVKLIDAKAHQVLGSWTVAELNKRASVCNASNGKPKSDKQNCSREVKALALLPAREELGHLEWAPNAQHLAVYGTQGSVWILTFGLP